MKAIPLTKGYVAIVDDEDYERLAQHKWHAHVSKHTVYAIRHAGKKSASLSRDVFMHREIMRPPSDMDIDHLNYCGIDNRKSNLRICTRRENLRNRRVLKTSCYKGVCWHKRTQKWTAQIRVNDRVKYLGVFTDEREAHQAYLRAAECLVVE